MSIRWYSILVLVLSGLPMLAAGQNSPAQNAGDGASTARSVPAPALSGVGGMAAEATEQETASDLPQLPTFLGGPKMSLSFRSEQARRNYLRGGVNVGAAYDDNLFLSPGGGQGTPIYSIFPNVALEQSRSRIRWNLGFAAGLAVNQGLSNRNQGAYDLNFDSQCRLSPHANLHVAEDFSWMTGFFDSGNSAPAVNGGGGPNASLITPLAKQRSSSTVVETNYQFAPKDVIGAGGSFYDLHFGDVPAGTQLVDSRTEAASAYWLHGLLRHDWAGVSYRFQRLTFNPGDGETLVHSFLAVNTLSLSNRLTLAAFVGPQYSDNRGLPPGSTGPVSHFSDWSVAGGIDAFWQKDRTTGALGYSRLVNDGGGVTGVVLAQTVHAVLRRELFPGWAGAIIATYGNNKALTVPFPGGATLVKVTSVGASVERNLGRSLGLRLGYTHDFQQQSGAADSARILDVHRNRISLTLGYQWAKPLGR